MLAFRDRQNKDRAICHASDDISFNFKITVTEKHLSSETSKTEIVLWQLAMRGTILNPVVTFVNSFEGSTFFTYGHMLLFCRVV